ncbi:hypothetical protein [Burkholderia ubonensis]|nr:hypothetical protein [Burkholderia ubonensis]
MTLDTGQRSVQRQNIEAGLQNKLIVVAADDRKGHSTVPTSLFSM